MFDIHSHILHAIDDGPRTIGESLATLANLANEGFTDVVATPHFNDQYPHVPISEVEARVHELQVAAHRGGIEIHLWAGHEVQLDGEVETALREGIVGTINRGPYFLLELPSYDLPIYLPTFIGRMRSLGYVPVIAHVERYAPIQRNPDAIVPLIELGALTQITASSLCGHFGSKARMAAETLVKRNLAHVIASDAHALSDRPSRFQEGVRVAEALAGSECVRHMVVDTPRAIIRGEFIRVPVVGQRKPKRRFWRLR